MAVGRTAQGWEYLVEWEGGRTTGDSTTRSFGRVCRWTCGGRGRSGEDRRRFRSGSMGGWLDQEQT